MKLLLDECVPRKLKHLLAGHDCRTASEAGYAGKQNGELLVLAERAGFDALLTLDRGIVKQQNLAGRNISLILLRVRSSRLSQIRPLVPALIELLARIRAGDVEIIGAEGTA